MNDNRKLPDDFNPWLAVDALQGVTRSICWYLNEGPAAEEPMPDDARASLIGLAWEAARLARDLNTYFRHASEAGLELPPTDTDGVRENGPGYAVN